MDTSCILGAYNIFTRANEYVEEQDGDGLFKIEPAGVSSESFCPWGNGAHKNDRARERVRRACGDTTARKGEYDSPIMPAEYMVP